MTTGRINQISIVTSPSTDRAPESSQPIAMRSDRIRRDRNARARTPRINRVERARAHDRPHRDNRCMHRCGVATDECEVHDRGDSVSPTGLRRTPHRPGLLCMPRWYRRRSPTNSGNTTATNHAFGTSLAASVSKSTADKARQTDCHPFIGINPSLTS